MTEQALHEIFIALENSLEKPIGNFVAIIQQL